MTYTDRFDYIDKVFAKETDPLKQVRASLTDPNDQISISAREGRFLQFLICASGVKHIVEIGTLGGYSALWMAEALPPGGRLFTIEREEARAKKAAAHFAEFDRHHVIHQLLGDAAAVLPALSKEGPFDMVFIDADKLNYEKYLDWAEKHVRRGGLIVGDNTFLFDSVWQEAPADNVRRTAQEAMRNFNRRLADPEKYTGILLPTEEGMTVAVKNF